MPTVPNPHFTHACQLCTGGFDLLTCRDCAKEYCTDTDDKVTGACLTLAAGFDWNKEPFVCKRCHLVARTEGEWPHTVVPRRYQHDGQLNRICAHRWSRPANSECVGLHIAMIVDDGSHDEAEILQQALRGRWEADDWPLTMSMYSISRAGKGRVKRAVNAECLANDQTALACQLLLIVMADIDPITGHLNGTTNTLLEFLSLGLPHPLKQQLNLPLLHAAIIISPLERIDKASINAMTTSMRQALTFHWVLHFVTPVADRCVFFNMIPGIVVMAMGHRRPIEQSALTTWAFDPMASTNTDFLLYTTDDYPSLFRRAGWSTRPWGHDNVLSCDCVEPSNSGGRDRHWKVKTTDPEQATLVCSWCGQEKQAMRSPHQRGAALVCALPKKIGSTYFVKWPFGRCPGLSGV